MNEAEREFVRQRAGNRCEYCRIGQWHMPAARFHIEHILPRQHGGQESDDNLALACVHCNLHKGPNLAGIDPADGKMVRLFSPRRDDWAEHFGIVGAEILGLSPVGRATVHVFAMNEEERLILRSELVERGEWP
jgi:HNH endonuclease